MSDLVKLMKTGLIDEYQLRIVPTLLEAGRCFLALSNRSPFDCWRVRSIRRALSDYALLQLGLKAPG